MSYNPATDYLGLWRNIAGQVSKLEMPALDLVVAALARAGIITLSVSATAPVANQSTTAWLQAAVPSYSAEGVLQLWNAATSAYAAATPALFFDMLQVAAGQNGVSWWTCAGGPPVNTVGNNGDFAIRTDEPGGIYGPKAAGAWPASPIPGTTDIISSAQLDLSFGANEGLMLFRDADDWDALPIGAANSVMVASGGVPTWEALSILLDAVFSAQQGGLLYRDVGAWQALAPGVANQVLSSGGPAANPAWAPRTAEFRTGDTIVFQQSAAPLGWTKQTAINDYGLRVTSGAVGVTAGSAFSSVFAQTAVGSTTVTTAQMPSHTHLQTIPGGVGVGGGGAFGFDTAQAGAVNTQPQGGGGSHTHSVNLALSYVDVIIASKN